MKFPWSKRKKEFVKENPPYQHPPQPSIQTRSYSIPCWDLKKEAKQQYRKAIIETLEKRCFEKSGIANMATRQLLSKDLGLRSWRTPPQGAGERSIWINHKTTKYQFMAINGVVQLSKHPKVSDIIIRQGYSGAITLGLHEIDEIYSVLPIIRKLDTFREDDELFERFGTLADIRMVAYFAEPYYFDEETVIQITVESPEDNKTGDRLMLTGFIVEPSGREIV